MRKESFEEKLRKSYDSYEAPTSQQSWSAIESSLSNSALGKSVVSKGMKWFLGMGLGLGIVVASIWMVNRTDSNDSSSSISNEQFTGVNPSEATHLPEQVQTAPEVLEPHATEELASGTNHSNLNVQSIKNSTPLSSNQSQGKNSFEIAPTDPSDLNNSKANGKAESNILSSVRQTCAGTEVNFKPQNSPTDGSYLWNFGDGAFSNEASPKHRFLKPGTYEVSLSVTDNKNAQINTVNMSETITILPNPSADFDWTFTNGGKEAPTVEINNQSSHFVSTEWKFSDGSVSEAMHPVKTFSTKGSHAVVVTATNEYGCKDQKVKYININSDYNLNAAGYVNCGDGFMPEGLTQLKGKFSLTIYDGSKKIFETKDVKNPWACTDLNGNKVEVNKQYPWIAIIHDAKTGEDRYYSGAVLVKP